MGKYLDLFPDGITQLYNGGSLKRLLSFPFSFYIKDSLYESYNFRHPRGQFADALAFFGYFAFIWMEG